MKKLKLWWYNYCLGKAIKKANKMKKLTGYKYFVLNMNGKPKAVAKRSIKELVRTRYFRKGVEVCDLEKKALYVTLTTAAVLRSHKS